MPADTLWIFGYGSLVWRPAFPHLRACPAWISGFQRRFWQGSTDHRGLPGKPGRVVTLIPDSRSETGPEPRSDARLRCWGTAYEVPSSDPDGVLERLDVREQGGYDRLSVVLSVQTESMRSDSAAQAGSDSRASHQATPAPSPGLETESIVYIAGPENENFLGPASVEEIATQVAQSTGPSGPNREYVFELAKSLRKMGAEDDHVFAVDAALRDLLGERRG